MGAGRSDRDPADPGGPSGRLIPGRAATRGRGRLFYGHVRTRRLAWRSQNMSVASAAALREQAARFRRLSFLITDARASKAIEDHVRDLARRAEELEAEEKRGEGERS